MMKLIIALLFFPLSVFAQQDWSKVEAAFGRKGMAKDHIFKLIFPRSDLHVSVGDVPIDPDLALTSWMSFLDQEGATLVIGDMILLATELPAVESKLIEDGIAITAIYDHLVHETPPLITVHIEARGNAEKIAEKIKSVFALTGTPALPAPVAVKDTDWTDVEEILGMHGQRQGNILQVTIPRLETVKEHGVDIHPSMGMATTINFQRSGDKLIAAGEFVLIAPEVRQVMKALQKHGYIITALHNNLLMENPHMFTMHVWAYDKPSKIAMGIFTALKEVNFVGK